MNTMNSPLYGRGLKDVTSTRSETCRVRFGPTPEMVRLRRSLAQLSVFKLVMETQISATWFDLEQP